jgi:hypothetical protein
VETGEKVVPSTSVRQVKMMRADYGRAKAGKPTRTGMGASQLRDFTKLRRPTRSVARSR